MEKFIPAKWKSGLFKSFAEFTGITFQHSKNNFSNKTKHLQSNSAY